MKCAICQRRDADRPQVCDPDRSWLDRTLVEIVELYALLPDAIGSGELLNVGEWVDERGVEHSDPVALAMPVGTIQRTVGQRVGGSREAPLPLRVDPLDLTLPARVATVHDGYGDQAGNLPVASVLDSWARDWADVRNMRETLPDPTVVELGRWLGNRHPWAADTHPAVDEYATELRRLNATVRAVVGIKSDRVYVGPCPVTDERGSCGAALTADQIGRAHV